MTSSTPKEGNRRTAWPEHLSAATTYALIGDKPTGPLWPSVNQHAANIVMCNIPPDEDYTNMLQHTIIISTHKALQAPMQP